jgi:hypothetical protein
MKVIVYISVLIFILPNFMQAQSSFNWSQITVVNDDDLLGFTRPRVTIDNSDAPVVMWGKKNNKEVYVSKMGSTSFGIPVKVIPSGETAFVQDWAGPMIASFHDTVFVTYKSQPENQGFVYTVRSVDGGNTFGDTVRVSNNNWTRFPTVAVGPGGRPYVAFMEFDSGFVNPHYSVATSVNGGNSYASSVIGSGLAPGEVCDCCPAFISVDNEIISLLFRNNDNDLRDIWVAISTDKAASFAKAADIDNNNWMINSCPSSGPSAIRINDSIVAVWMSGANASPKVNIGTADISNLTIGVNTEVEPNISPFSNQNYPKIAGEGDTLGLVWQESGAGKLVIKALFSTSGIQGLLAADIDTVNDITSVNQKNPHLAYKDGVFHIVWTNENTKEVLYRSVSISNSTGINNKRKNELKIQVSPNPSNGIFNVDVDAKFINGSLTIYDLLGEIMWQDIIKEKRTSIEIDALRSGFYMIKAEKNGDVLSQQIVIKN